MKKPDLSVVEGGKIETVEIPERVEFTCWKCRGSCLVFPRAKPAAVQHALPTCTEWRRVAANMEDVERFLIKCGAHLLVPAST